MTRLKIIICVSALGLAACEAPTTARPVVILDPVFEGKGAETSTLRPMPRPAALRDPCHPLHARPWFNICDDGNDPPENRRKEKPGRQVKKYGPKPVEKRLINK